MIDYANKIAAEHAADRAEYAERAEAHGYFHYYESRRNMTPQEMLAYALARGGMARLVSNDEEAKKWAIAARELAAIIEENLK